jgi:hypothetical protein
MKSVGGFLRNVVQRKETGLAGKTLRVGPYTVRVEAHLGDGGFAAIYRVRDMTTPAVFALKHMRLGADPEALRDCHVEVSRRLALSIKHAWVDSRQTLPISRCQKYPVTMPTCNRSVQWSD